jgi:hypothetical protein
MTEPPSKVLIRLALTPRQQRQIREATGREVHTLDLRLVPLASQAASVTDTEQRSGSPEPGNRVEPRRSEP